MQKPSRKVMASAPCLMDDYGGKNWRKRKGFAYVRVLTTGEIRRAEVHWYEAHGIGKVEMKVKKCL
ncbi:hypothetical protein AGMMS50289_09990 [Betaproteobacteria bacterium]|nr:hypothetical protein AGMMS50289_09990 [Betaproteobacteria bacterium]